MLRSLSARLTLAFAGVGAATAIIIVVLVNIAVDAVFSRYLADQQRTQQAEVAAALSDSYRRSGGWNAADLQMVTLSVLSSGGSVRIEDSTGRQVWQGPRRGMGTGAGEGTGPMAAVRLGPETPLRIEVGGHVVGVAYLRLPQIGSLAEQAAFRSGVTWLILAGGGIAMVAATALAIVLARRMGRPARALTAAARAISAGDRTVRVTTSGPSEFAEMGRAFNLMADSVEAEDRLRRAFARDVAHEMRTPLAVLQAHLEGLQDSVLEPTDQELSALHGEVIKASRLVADLEVLGSADAAAFSLQPQHTNLRSAVADAVGEASAMARDRGVALLSDLSDAPLVGDPGRLRQVAANLISNALKFTPAGGEVSVQVCDQNRSAVLEVMDNGPGIPADELPHIFERFFRGRNAEAGGSGIGLAVARDLVRAHGGEITAASIPGQGTRVTVRLPAGGHLETAHQPRPVRGMEQG